MPALKPCSCLIDLPIAGINYVWSQVLGSPLCELFLLWLCHFLVVCVALNLLLTPGIKSVYHQCVSCMAAWSKGVCIKASCPCQLHCRVLVIHGINGGIKPLCCCWFCFVIVFCCFFFSVSVSVSLSLSLSLLCLCVALSIVFCNHVLLVSPWTFFCDSCAWNQHFNQPS